MKKLLLVAMTALGFFGLIMKLGPITNWDLNLDKKPSVNDEMKTEDLPF